MLYVRHEMDECQALIEEQLKECGGLCEYAIYVKGTLLFDACTLPVCVRLARSDR